MSATLSDAQQNDLLQRQAKRRSWSITPSAAAAAPPPPLPLSTITHTLQSSGPDLVYAPVASHPTSSLDFDDHSASSPFLSSPSSSSSSSSGRTSPISTSAFFQQESIDGLLGHSTSNSNLTSASTSAVAASGVPTPGINSTPYYHRRINSLMLAGQRSRTPDSLYNLSASSSLTNSTNPSMTSLPSSTNSTNSSVSSTSTVVEKRSSLGRTRSLHASSNSSSTGGITTTATPASKRWSSSVIMDSHNGLSSPRPLHLHHRRNSSLGISHPSTPFLTEQERLLQEKLQELARSENARLNDGTISNNTTTNTNANANANTNTNTTTSSASSAAASLLSSPLVSSYSSSSVGTSPRSSFQSSPNAATTGGPVPVGPKVIIPSGSQNTHYRHLSLQSYYNTTNNRAPDMSASPPAPAPAPSYSTATATQSLGGPSSLSSAVASGFPMLPAAMNNYSNVYNNNTIANNNNNNNIYRPMSPRAAARAAALASLNAADEFPTSTARSFSRRSSSASSCGSMFLPSGVAGARTSSVLSESGTSSGMFSPSPPASPSVNRRFARHSYHYNSHHNSYGFQRPKDSLEICEGEATSTVPEGFYIISASDLERLRRMEHLEEFGSLVEAQEKSSSLFGRSGSGNNDGSSSSSKLQEDGTPVMGPQRPGNIGGTVLSWRMTGEMMRTWMTAYKSPSAVIDLVQFVWATVSNGAAVREELWPRSHTSPEEEFENKETENNGSALLPPKDVIEGLRDAVVAQVARAGEGARGVAQVAPVARAAGRAVLQATVDWACVGLAMSIIFVQVVLLGVMTIAFLLGDALVYPVRVARVWYYGASANTSTKNVKSKQQQQQLQQQQQQQQQHNSAPVNSTSQAATATAVSSEPKKVEEKEMVYDSPVVLVRRLTRRRAETESLVVNNKLEQESLQNDNSNNNQQQQPEESMQVRAKRAALKKAKRRSRY
ncbi:uncharacterized protein SAPINGB_P003822 [Magnusiomyces paraingens]|uniref:Uncharacterized protein n=1 Tax=Magnusiomyces paraingens TaxID=2606893 RepID=A0A5E8BSC8_9ASCO|nr:uncharacterized protein SAPINGB_P003822 [Saprochaete ingens]VVT53931.1 unnamed protein product [Saprochaete ingens]